MTPWGFLARNSDLMLCSQSLGETEPIPAHTCSARLMRCLTKSVLSSAVLKAGLHVHSQTLIGLYILRSG